MILKSPTGLLFSMLLFISVSYFVGGVYGVFGYLLNGTTLAKLPLDFGFLGSQILGIPIEAHEVGIRRYDKLLEIGDRPFLGYTDMVEEIQKRKAGDLLPVVIRRASDGSIANLQIKLRPRLKEAVPAWNWLWKIATQIVFPFFCMLIGFWVIWNKPRDPRAWLLLAIMLASSAFIPTWTWTGYSAAFVAGWQALLSSMLPAAMVMFAIYFPDRSQIDRSWPWLKWLFLAPLSICSAVVVWWAVFKQINMALNDWTMPYLNGAFNAKQILGMAGFGLFFAILGRKSTLASTKDARRRLQLLG